jgi:hypothetical protein
MTPAQSKALTELCHSDGFVRNREGWKTPAGRFVPLVVMARLRQAKLAKLAPNKQKITATEAGRAIGEAKQ